ncbi:sorting nexin-21 [Pangasianodon hypophthalmus]|uniref:sorting nexin-21 n=1 Tax=Pangasianodon hypophthalmus TaxID=310915 RepID=UPI0023070DFB|nr:sorting nexin-21 [Pangasianodon hypophthalmus]XP_034168058.2 sorting nexin-21 [Pangasianodon hypophthalmus]XP_034168061.2 sorting nexin-21 [Pangasianodon hypophthalmus]XP_034168062.2 sorting nexin-21 [Pangasianodon hypophthalmus]
MASKLLDRLRRSLFKEGELHVDTEDTDDFPESSELEDDTDNVSSRLSGTLCFEGDGVMDSEDAGETSGPDSDSDCFAESIDNACSSTDISPTGPTLKGSSMLTRQLQESWRNLRTRCVLEKLLFEVTDASVVQEANSKYVLYTIHVIHSGTFDKTPAVIARRYTDFERLHQLLRRHHREAMEGVHFPRKKLRRNFAAETIGKRSRAFEQYLSHLHSLTEVRASPAFLEFFYLGELRTGQTLVRAGRYEEALGTLVNALRLQEKLDSPQKTHRLFTLSAVASCYQELERLSEAQEHCEHALNKLVPSIDMQKIQQKQLHPLLVPLLQANVRLSWKISKDKRRWEALLHEIQELGVDVENQPDLKECIVKENLSESEG